MARSEMIRKPRTWPVFRVERTSSVHQQKTGNDPGCVKTQKSKDDENNFPKSIAPEQAREVSTTRNYTWRNAHSTPSQRRCLFAQPRPRAELAAGPPVLWTAYGCNLTTQCLCSPAGSTETWYRGVRLP